jgi:hypothetical protein
MKTIVHLGNGKVLIGSLRARRRILRDRKHLAGPRGGTIEDMVNHGRGGRSLNSEGFGQCAHSLYVFRPRGRAKVPKKIVRQRPNKGQEFLFQSSVGLLWCFVATSVRILDFFAHDDMLAEACHADAGMRSSKRIHEIGAEIILGGGAPTS